MQYLLFPCNTSVHLSRKDSNFLLQEVGACKNFHFCTCASVYRSMEDDGLYAEYRPVVMYID